MAGIKEKITAPRGTKDIVPADSYKWQYVEGILRKTAEDFGYKEIRFPTFESTALFVRGVGDTTDVVQKEMYTFKDKGGRDMALRPEGTASVVRSYIENSLYAAGLPVKCYYIVPNFRYEKPQAGRLREFHQFGAENFGVKNPLADAELIAFADTVLKRLGLKKFGLEINSIGCPDCRPKYYEALKKHFQDKEAELCKTCLERLEKNPMRILDCKNSECAEIAKTAPIVKNFLCDDCREHFDKTKILLDAMGIVYEVNYAIVRGLDYYSKTVFEFVTDEIGAQGTVLGGGRYDGLVEMLGGNHTPALGFAAGMERLLLLMEHQGTEIPKPEGISVFIASIGENADIKAQVLSYELRKLGLSVERDTMGRSLKAQLKYADKLGAKYSLVLGDEEISSGKGVLKNMSDGEKVEVNLSSQEILNLMN